ncbi:MAG: dTMP kinase [Fimbriimonadaceae bacterium]|nr:dTMP kinase [Fimbriimonadaceae bacterium]
MPAFITFEGPEGAGKSTALTALAERLTQVGHKVVVTREPGATEFGRQVRDLLLHGENLPPRSELFLFLADRANHVQNLIRPALNEGAIVLCDRYADSTVVYQGYARGLDIERLRELNAFATDGLVPDLTLLFDLDPELGLSRLTNKDRLDKEGIDFHRRVREGFKQEAAREPGRWVTLDASQPPEEVLCAAWEAVNRLVG